MMRMEEIDFEKYKFKLRSLPNSKTFPRYFEAYMFLLGFYLVYNFVNICLFSHDFNFTLPAVFLFAIPIIFVNIYARIESGFRNVTNDTMKEVVVHIRLKQTQSLIEKLEENPEILNGKFNKRSLLYWARHHKNFEANAIIIEQMKKQA